MKMYVKNAINGWRVDPDGFLRITACILKEGVYPYAKSEMQGVELLEADIVDEQGMVWQYIPASAFNDEALKTLEGKPVIVGSHDWQTAQDNKAVGSIAGSAKEVNGEVIVDLLITDEDTIKRITNKELTEISAGYESDVAFEKGKFEDTEYVAIQTNLRFNHILLLPDGCGRCGHDVRILNKKHLTREGNKMTIKLKMLNGDDKEYSFTNAEDAKVAEEMAEDQKEFNADEVAKAMEEIKQLQAQKEELEAKYATVMQTLTEAQAQIAKLTSPEGQAELVNEALAQDENEDEILNSEFDPAERDEIKNRCNNAKTYADRRKELVMAVMNSKGKNVADWNQESIDGAFKALCAVAKVRNSKAMGGVKVVNSAPKDNLSRILRSFKAKA